MEIVLKAREKFCGKCSAGKSPLVATIPTGVGIVGRFFRTLVAETTERFEDRPSPEIGLPDFRDLGNCVSDRDPERRFLDLLQPLDEFLVASALIPRSGVDAGASRAHSGPHGRAPLATGSRHLLSSRRD